MFFLVIWFYLSWVIFSLACGFKSSYPPNLHHCWWPSWCRWIPLIEIFFMILVVLWTELRYTSKIVLFYFRSLFSLLSPHIISAAHFIISLKCRVSELWQTLISHFLIMTYASCAIFLILFQNVLFYPFFFKQNHANK